MKRKCFQKSCKEIPHAYCKCQGKTEAMCAKHIRIHFENNTIMTHYLIPALKNVSSELKVPVIEFFKLIIKKNKELKKRLIFETEKLLKLSNEVSKYFENFNKFISFNISQVVKNSRILVPVTDKMYLSNSESAMINFEELESIKINTIKEFKLMNVLSRLDSCQIKISEVIKDFCEHRLNLDEDEMYFFKQNTKDLYRFNPKEETLQSFTINSVNNQGHLASICKIDKFKLFVYGGIINYPIASAFIIDTLNFSVELLPQGIELYTSSAQLYSKRIYIFGGYFKNKIISESRYFDLSNRAWVSIAPSPSICRDTSTLLLDQEILISGFQNNMFVFNILSNQYINLNAGLSIQYYNILILYSNQIMLLAIPYSYICEDWKQKKTWRLVIQVLSFNCTTS